VNGEGPRRRPRAVGVIVLGLCVAALGFAIVSLAVGTGGSEQVEITGAQEVQSLLGGIEQEGRRLGSSDADVTAQVFNDLQCGPCSDWNREVVVPLIRGPVRGGQLKLEFHNFPMTESGFFLGAYATVAAGKQDYEWQFMQLFFANQDKVEDRGADQDFLNAVARGVGVVNFNVEQWQRDMDDDDVEQTLVDDEELSAGRFPAEPAIVVVGPRGTKELIESPSLDEVEAAIAQVR
jgi:protein-disulfide isomerase